MVYVQCGKFPVEINSLCAADGTTQRPAADCSLATRPTLHRGTRVPNAVMQLSAAATARKRYEENQVCGCPSTNRKRIIHAKRDWATEAFMSCALSQPFLGRPQNLYCALARHAHSPDGCCSSTLQARHHWREGSINEWGPAIVAKGRRVQYGILPQG